MLITRRCAVLQEHLHNLESELQIPEDELPLYVLYAESDPSGKWRVQAVPVSMESFESRKPLPEACVNVGSRASSISPF